MSLRQILEIVVSIIFVSPVLTLKGAHTKSSMEQEADAWCQ